MGRAFLLTLLVCLDYMLSAQQYSCGSSNSSIDTSQRLIYEHSLAQYIQNTKLKSDSADIYIPVVIHIVWHEGSENISDDIVLSQIEALNRDYTASNIDVQYVPNEFKPLIGNAGIHFCLAAIDPNGNRTTGIIRVYTGQTEIGISQNLFVSAQGGSDQWDVSRYLNVWVANTGRHIIGFGTYPWSIDTGGQGVVVNSSCFGISSNPRYGLGRVCVHEVGHYLGLIHPWGDVYDCSVDDSVPDTPMQIGPYYECPSYPTSGCSPSEMFMNYMDYANDQCELLFTKGQISRMLATLHTSRSSLINNGTACQKILNGVDEELNIYPNPSSGLLNIEFKNKGSEILNIKIYNALGQLVYTQSELVNTTTVINLSHLPKGLYYLKTQK